MNNICRDTRTRKDVTACFDTIVRRECTNYRIEIDQPAHVYPIDAANFKYDWLFATRLGFQRMRELLLRENEDRAPIKRLWLCGSSQGVDAIQAWEILRPNVLVVSDILAECVKTSKENILANCSISSANLRVYCGNLAEPLILHDERVEVAYANLPTIPKDATQEEICSSGCDAATFYPANRLEQCQPFIRDNLLELYYSFLMDAKKCLDPDGYVICVIGGRRKWPAIVRLFQSCGYSSQLLYFGVKPQHQADLCFPAYARLENDTRRLTFYEFPESWETFQQLFHERGLESTFLHSSNHELGELHAELIQRLERHEIDAAKAEERRRKGLPSGHLVYVVVGRLLTNGDKD